MQWTHLGGATMISNSNICTFNHVECMLPCFVDAIYLHNNVRAKHEEDGQAQAK